MQRILDPNAIKASSERSIARVRLPDRTTLFLRRAERLRQLSGIDAIGRSIADYLHLAAAIAEAQHLTLAEANTWPRERFPIRVLEQLCAALLSSPSASAKVREVCQQLRGLSPEEIDSRLGALVARAPDVEPMTAPFLMAALQVDWVDLACRLSVSDVPVPRVPGICPICDTLPVASVVTAEQGYRYLSCALCATEWHMVRVKCASCQSTKGIAYHSIEGGPPAIQAESCAECHSYLKILYQEKDSGVEAVADDLASLTLDLLMSDAGYHRGTSNPLLWQRS